jgi:hypothetical protein
MESEKVIRLRRDEDGRVARVPIDPDMTMGRADQLLTSQLFDLDTTIDPETQQSIGEYQKVLGKRDRTPQEEEEFQRLNKILRFRIPVATETPAERRAEELVTAVIQSQFGEQPPREAGAGLDGPVFAPALQVLARVAQQPIFVAAGDCVAILAQLLDGLVPLGAARAGAQRVGQQFEERVGFDGRGSWHAVRRS